MSRGRDIVVVGGGINGLVAACYLARAGLRPLVLERRGVPGGAAVTEEIHPGFRCPTLAQAAGPFLPEIVRELQLADHGLSFVRPEVRVLCLGAGQDADLRIYEDPAWTAAELRRVSEKDAARYGEFHECFARLGRAFLPLLLMTPPDIDHPGAGDLFRFLGFGRAFRGLGKKDEFRFLRYLPMPVGDLCREWFETPLLLAAIAARGISGTFAGPYSAGTSLQLFHQAAFGGDGHVTAPAALVRGGPGALAQALAAAARSAGAELRTGAEVARIVTGGGKVRAVVLASGEEIAARAVVSGADPKRTFLGLCDPTDLDPEFLWRVKNYRSQGCAAKVNLALSALPSFGRDEKDLMGRIHVGPDLDYLERAFDAAKYGGPSAQPYLDLTIPSLCDPSLCEQGHVMSIYVQYAPYKLKSGDWDTERARLGDAVVRTLAAYAPDLPDRIVARQVLTPLDLERDYGLWGGHPLHGEPTLDQFFAFRPLLGWARYRAPPGLDGLYLCGAGTHPGGGVTGVPGRNASREVLRDLR